MSKKNDLLNEGEQILKNLEFQKGFGVGAVVQTKEQTPSGLFKDTVTKVSYVKGEVLIYGAGWVYNVKDLILIRRKIDPKPVPEKTYKPWSDGRGIK
jgi:hypothetical protein